MASEEITALIVSVAELKTTVEQLKVSDERMRENHRRVYQKLDRLMYAFIALLAGIIGDIVSHNMQ
jgi:hypothetical protein